MERQPSCHGAFGASGWEGGPRGQLGRGTIYKPAHLNSRLRAASTAGGREMPAGTDGYRLIEGLRLRALRAGFQLHLARPVQPSELVTVSSLAVRRSG